MALGQDPVGCLQGEDTFPHLLIRHLVDSRRKVKGQRGDIEERV
jgi:hypothetical protein